MICTSHIIALQYPFNSYIITQLEPTTVDLDQEERNLQQKCTGLDEAYFRLILKTDDYGFENSWKVHKKRNNGNWKETEHFGPPEKTKYASESTYIGGFCLPQGQYKFTIYDLFRDGMKSGDNGSYEISVDGVKKGQSNNSNWGERKHEFTIGSSTSTNNNNNNNNNNPTLDAISGRNDEATMQDLQWLQAHNTRRKTWHTRNGKSYVALKWSSSLKKDAKNYAEELVQRSCGTLIHDKNNVHGENLASHHGTGSYAERKHPDDVVTRWVEDEAKYSYPANGHLTQCIWRGTKWVGCAEAWRNKSGGGKCWVQVCRYAKPGNCNMNAHKDGSKNWWKKPMLADHSPCGPDQ